MDQEPQAESRTVTVGAAVTPAEANRLQALADRLGTTKSAALRAALVAGLDRLEGVEDGDLKGPALTRTEALAEAVLTQMSVQDKAYRRALELIFEGVEEIRGKLKTSK
ncbi:hypothetical protein [Silanimonas sp.]|jgi:hypothetical protein|uniref:hypothetical protein n=1 Tax=Silanimonas sp. TaxID=1929290 RepID=UPI0022C2E651|nr:hypothetical protein [Silanimonas sp.]MCZ8063994.1 hypothetical protein [Silanimonas sp.]